MPISPKDTAMSSGDTVTANQNKDRRPNRNPPPIKTSPTNTYWRLRSPRLTSTAWTSSSATLMVSIR